jgi:hypothetical protein
VEALPGNPKIANQTDRYLEFFLKRCRAKSKGASVAPRAGAVSFGRPQIQNRPRLASKTEFNGIGGGLRTYIRTRAGPPGIHSK